MDRGRVETDQVLVVGSGPAGLATAAELLRRGIPTTVLERGERPAAAWAGRYDGLRFNTSRWWSALPGAPFPRSYGWFPTRDQYVDYLDAYAARHHVPVRTGVEVRRIDPTDDRDGWTLTTGEGAVNARHVVVATGIANRPVLPGWAHGSPFTGTVVHSAAYRNAGPYRDRRVLVVGAGSSGMEIAHELAVGGAAEVLLSVRTPPNLLLRSSGGLPTDLPVPVFFRLPVPLVDGMLRRLQRLTVGDLSGHGLPPSPEGSIAALMARGAGTAIVDRGTVASIRDGSIRVVPAVSGLDTTGARFTDGRRADVDDVVLATGFSTALEEMVGHLDVLGVLGLPRVADGGEAAPGLRFVGYVYRPGLTGFVGRLARRAARELARERRGAPAPAPV
ncbi:flavin-containing monooxygenase [Ornithinimicrobium sp. W1665]|uniref:flavin-containing monooxygenase n=1 Tax=Ornithinimicrobium sp. W1665 TaxID=3416666 RepID=UPI003CF49B52